MKGKFSTEPTKPLYNYYNLQKPKLRDAFYSGIVEARTFPNEKRMEQNVSPFKYKKAVFIPRAVIN